MIITIKCGKVVIRLRYVFRWKFGTLKNIRVNQIYEHQFKVQRHHRKTQTALTFRLPIAGISHVLVLWRPAVDLLSRVHPTSDNNHAQANSMTVYHWNSTVNHWRVIWIGWLLRRYGVFSQQRRHCHCVNLSLPTWYPSAMLFLSILHDIEMVQFPVLLT